MNNPHPRQMETLLNPNPKSDNPPDWPLFDIPVERILEYLYRKTGEAVSTLTLHQSIPDVSGCCPDWKTALHIGIHQRLHLNLGIPGVDIPEHPIEENAVALYTALLLGWEVIPVILSGELELAVEEGLIPDSALRRIRECCRTMA